jgi:predicted Zn-dependent protease
LDEPIAVFQKAVKINPNSYTIRFNLGKALFQNGKLDEAVMQLQEVLRLKPDLSSAQEHLVKAQALGQQRKGHK